MQTIIAIIPMLIMIFAVAGVLLGVVAFLVIAIVRLGPNRNRAGNNPNRSGDPGIDPLILGGVAAVESRPDQSLQVETSEPGHSHHHHSHGEASPGTHSHHSHHGGMDMGGHHHHGGFDPGLSQHSHGGFDSSSGFDGGHHH